MERDTNQMSQNPSLCRSGCGFYGNPSNDGLCSKCYKDALKRKQAAPTAAPSSMAPSTTSLDNQSNAELLQNLALLQNSLAAAETAAAAAAVAASSSSSSSSSSTISAITAQESSHSQVEIKIDSNVDLPNSKDSAKTIEEAGSIVEPVAAAATTMVDEATTTNSNDETPKTHKKKKTKCAQCKANVGVISFPCRCGGIFCGMHRYASEHKCTFDYKEHGAEEIRKNNPQVIGEKVQKI